MGTRDNDYSYIEVFIGFLREIIEIIKELFSGFGSNTDTTDTTADPTV